MKRNALVVFAALLITFTVHAEDRLFTRVYQSNVLAKGGMELEYWNTVRSGRDHLYNRIDQRLELELGLGKGIQTAFYLNLSTRTFSLDDSTLHSSNSFGFSNEWKFKLSDATANKIGSALYGEIGFDGHEIELEGKLILDKTVGKNNFAFNLVGELELEYEYEAEEHEIELEKEFSMELDFGYMRNLGKKTGLGLEVRNNNIFHEGDLESSPWFAGPVLHVGGDRWFLNVGIMPQLFNAKKVEGYSGNLDLVNHEKVEGRMLVSFSF